MPATALDYACARTVGFCYLKMFKKETARTRAAGIAVPVWVPLHTRKLEQSIVRCWNEPTMRSAFKIQELRHHSLEQHLGAGTAKHAGSAEGVGGTKGAHHAAHCPDRRIGGHSRGVALHNRRREHQVQGLKHTQAQSWHGARGSGVCTARWRPQSQHERRRARAQGTRAQRLFVTLINAQWSWIHFIAQMSPEGDGRGGME